MARSPRPSRSISNSPAVSSGRGSRTGEGVPPSVNYKLEMRRPLSNRRETTGKTAGRPPEDRRKTTGKTVGKTAGKPPGDHWQNCRQNCREKPRFWVTFASLNKSREGALRRHFSAPGGGCHKEPTSQAQPMYTSIRWGWWNGDLWVFRRDEGHSRSDDAKIGISR